jgi:PadR family transcriptional regulator PadR
MGNGQNDENRHSPLSNTLLEPVLLTLLKEKPRHGYSILSDLVALGIDTLHPSVVYRILRDLEELEWIQSDWENDETQGPPRRVYRLTTTGEDALRNWQNELKKKQDLISTLLTRIEK